MIVYFRHPSRDFQQTHEAFRLRRYDDEVFITYKGPVVDDADKNAAGNRDRHRPHGRKTSTGCARC